MSVDQELIERVAKAICKSGKFETGQGTCALLCMDQLGIARNNCPHASKIHSHLAIANIKAMREPTEKMIEVGSDIDINDEYRIGNSVAELVWKAMIDAIIGE